nr:MAG TPA: hypothetical protein [Caudoviricetes sp.]
MSMFRNIMTSPGGVILLINNNLSVEITITLLKNNKQFIVNGNSSSDNIKLDIGDKFNVEFSNPVAYKFDLVDCTVLKSDNSNVEFQVIGKNPNVTFLILNSYVVTFNASGGTSIESQTVLEGEKAQRPNNPSKSDYNFLGWYLNDVLFDFENTPITSDITLIAKWEYHPELKTITGSANVELVMTQEQPIRWGVKAGSLNFPVNFNKITSVIIYHGSSNPSVSKSGEVDITNGHSVFSYNNSGISWKPHTVPSPWNILYYRVTGYY